MDAMDAMDAMDTHVLPYFEAFTRSRRISDLNVAIESARLIIRKTPETHPNYGDLLNNLGAMIQTRFECFQGTKDQDEAVDLGLRALETTGANHPNYTIFLSTLSNKLQKRFERRNMIGDLELAINLSRRAQDSTLRRGSYSRGALRDLSVKLVRRYEVMGNLEDLLEAISWAEQAAEALSGAATEDAELWHNLANMYDSLFQANGDDKDLRRAVEYATSAVDATPQNHPNHGDMLNGLGGHIYKQFERTSRVEDLEKAISTVQKAINFTPNDHPYMAGCLTNLGHMLWKRFERTARMEDLEIALKCVETGLAKTYPESVEFPVRSNSLGAMLQTLYERTGAVKDLDRAIEATREALQKGQSHPRRQPLYLNNLAVLLLMRFKRTGTESALSESIEKARQAVELSSASVTDSSQASHWNNLGLGLEARFRQRGMPADLEEAIQCGRNAVAATPPDHSDLPGRLNNLGHRLCLLLQEASLDEALKCFRQSWSCDNGIPFHRVDAALQVVKFLKTRGQWRGAKEIASQAIDLLPIMNNRSLERQDQQHVASKFSGLVSDACSLSLQAGDSAEEALTLLERGRGSIMSLLIDDRSDTEHLRASDPNEAETYERLRREVNMATPKMVQAASLAQQRTTNRLELVSELHACIRRIRNLPGCERFLMGPSPDELRKCASEGSIVVVNVTDIRADAIIVSVRGVKVMSLPGLLSANKLSFLQKDLESPRSLCESETRVRDIASEEVRGRDESFLSWLWLNCVKLILDELRASPVLAIEELPRVWWIGTGIANSFPFHAAGDYSAGSSENTLHQIIPSYTPTIKALAYSRSLALRRARPNGEKASVLIVTMPTTPGQRPLGGVHREKLAIEEACKSVYLYETLEHPTADKVLASLAGSDIIHFACHGSSNPTDPSDSHLLLQKSGTSGPVVDKLTLSSISSTETMGKAWIAYLSACSTAEVKARNLADESLHMASAFQIAGFAHVIGSLWLANDDVCAQVAENFYLGLSRSGTAQFSNRAVAAALRNSILQVRSNFACDPSVWAAFIHLGA